jgi:hypothetical protein
LGWSTVWCRVDEALKFYGVVIGRRKKAPRLLRG